MNCSFNGYVRKLKFRMSRITRVTYLERISSHSIHTNHVSLFGIRFLHFVADEII